MEVTLPDGTIATFPDNMPQEQIADVVKSHIASQNANLPGLAPTPAQAGVPSDAPVPSPELPGAHASKVMGSNLLAGALDLAGVPGSVMATLPKPPPVPSYSVPPPTDDPIAQLAAAGHGLSLPSSQDLLTGAKSMGLIDQPSQQPQGEGERLLAAAARGAGGTLPLALGGGIGALAKAGLQGAASGIGGEIGQRYLPVSESPAISALAGVVAGQGAGGATFGALSRGANALRGIGNPVVEAYDLANVKPRLAGDVTGSPFLQGVQSLAMRSPFGGRALHAAKNSADDFANSIEDTATGLGGARSATDAGLTLQGGMRQWLTDWRQAQTNAEAAVDAKVSSVAPVPIAPVMNTLQRTAGAMQGAPNVASVMTDPVFKDLSAALASDAGIGTGTLPWETMRAWRTKVGEKLDQSLVSRDGTDAAWKSLYGSLSGALGDTAHNAGAAGEWAAVNDISSRGHQFIDTIGNNILNHFGAHNTIPPEQAASFALANSGLGGSNLKQLRQEMPGAVDNLAAYKLRDMATATPGRQTQQNPISANTFSTELNRLSPEARDALFGGIDPKIAALQTVAERGKDTYSRFGNPSGTSSANQHAGLLGFPMAIAGGVFAGRETGIPGGGAIGAAGATLPYLAGPVASNLTAREALTRYLAAPTGGPGVGASRLYRAAGAWPSLQPILEGAAGR